MLVGQVFGDGQMICDAVTFVLLRGVLEKSLLRGVFEKSLDVLDRIGLFR